MTTREQQKILSFDLLSKSRLYKQIEDDIYKIIKDRKINISLICGSLGLSRNTAYYRLKTKSFTSEQLIQIAEKAFDIYQ